MALFLDQDLSQRLERDLQNGNLELLNAWRTVSSNYHVKELRLDDALGMYGGPDSPSVIRVCPLAHPFLIDTLRE